MKGWFDAFRNDGGPTLYNFSNRTAVTGDVALITILTVFTTIYVAFLIIFPGIRKERFTTFWAVTLSLFVGATILISIFGSTWHVSNAAIKSTYRAFSKEKLSADIGVYVGLNHVNITLQAFHRNWTTDVDFNERFYWLDLYQMGDSFREAIQRGLPFPVLTVAEYFTTGQDGLAWGSQYRAAGYFAIITLWASFATWMLMNLMLIVVPRYGALLMTTCGFMLLATLTGYFSMLPENPLVIYIEGQKLEFGLGWCFWLVMIAGSVALLTGVIITTIEILNPHSFSTILEVDYDTPYDRHVIIEESKVKRYEKRKNNSGKLEEPDSGGIGTRILRRLNSRSNDDTRKSDISSNKRSHHHHHHHSPESHNFEMVSAHPWKYPSYHNKSSESRSRSRSRSPSSQNSIIISPYSREVPPVHNKEQYRYPNVHVPKPSEENMW